MNRLKELSTKSGSKREKQILNGPIAGPKIGPIIDTAIAAPLLSTGIIFAMVPALSVKGEDAAIPTKNLNAINAPKLLATAQAIVKMRNKTLLTCSFAHGWIDITR
jgi:hypothetical protein